MPRRPGSLTPGSRLFAVFVFVLVTIPRAGIKFGPVPLYLIDILVVFLLVAASRLPPMSSRRRFSRTVILIFVLAMASETVGMVRFGTIEESVYIILRTTLAFSVFFVAGQIVRTIEDIRLILQAVVLGMLITASLMILTSLPMTRTLVTDLVFSIRFLEPAANEVLDIFGEAGESGVRGRTLVGVSIIGATFINVCWPLAALLLRWPWPVGIWRNMALAACLLAPMGVLMSYSRGPILGSALIVVVALLLGLHRMRRGILFPIAVAAALILTIGVGSQLFYFDRLTNRVEAMFEAPTEDERESERILAYVEPLEHVADHPGFFIVGEGITVSYAIGLRPPAMAGKATHAVFAIAYYSYGLVASILYILLILRALLFAGLLAVSKQRTVENLLAQPLFLAIVALLPWAAFGHAAVSTPHGAMLFFLLIGLLSALAHFRAPVRRRKPVSHRTYVDRPHPAFG
jgi:hypothetical protein